MIRRPPRSTLFPYTNALPIYGFILEDHRADVRFLESTLQAVECELIVFRSEEHTSELQSPDHLVCRLLLEKKKNASEYRAPHYNIANRTSDAKHCVSLISGLV